MKKFLLIKNIFVNMINTTILIKSRWLSQIDNKQPLVIRLLKNQANILNNTIEQLIIKQCE